MNAHVSLIGAGPGDPGLLTLRGAELLARCDVVLYDGLSNQEMLRHAPTAEHICVGKHGQIRIWRQDEIIAEMLRHATAGRRVARLKGGDPAVFARTAEEVDALREAKIPFEIVPGITAALAAGSYAGIPITHRGLASAVALVTGHEEPSKQQSSLDWDALAKFPGTLVVYMGVTTAETWTSALIEAGRPTDTPAAIIRRCSHVDQQVIHCPLGEVAERLTPASKIRPPVIVIIGPVTALASTMNWFDRRPLHGQRVLVTRPADQADALAAPLRELGAVTLEQAAIEIAAPPSWDEVDRAISQLDDFDVLVFCSRNGVKYFIERLLEHGLDTRRLAAVKLAVVGSQTAAALKFYHLHADLVPSEFHATALAETICDHPELQRCLLVRASRGKDDLPTSLRAAGKEVQQVVAYTHGDVAVADETIIQAMRQGQLDWVTVTSSASARNLVHLFGDMLKQCRLASLSPLTSATLRELGLEVTVEADPATVPALVQAICDYPTDASLPPSIKPPLQTPED